jgi:hypothetical protein
MTAFACSQFDGAALSARPSEPLHSDALGPVYTGVKVAKCRAFLVRRRGARSLRRGCGRRGRDGALKTDWTKPWHVGASYGDRMAPVTVSWGSRGGRSAGLCGANSHNGMRAGLALWRCRNTASARSVADRFGSKLLQWLGRGKRSVGGIGASAGVMTCRRSGGMVWRAGALRR